MGSLLGKQLFPCFVPKYLGLPVLTKYFVKNCSFVSWAKYQFSLFYFNFGPLLHLQYLKIHMEAFPQSWRYGKYLSFATKVNPAQLFWDQTRPIIIWFWNYLSSKNVLICGHNATCIPTRWVLGIFTPKHPKKAFFLGK